VVVVQVERAVVALALVAQIATLDRILQLVEVAEPIGTARLGANPVVLVVAELVLDQQLEQEILQQ
jgi:hypothetical protein